jgi:hypothetical protein
MNQPYKAWSSSLFRGSRKSGPVSIRTDAQLSTR